MTVGFSLDEQEYRPEKDNLDRIAGNNTEMR